MPTKLSSVYLTQKILRQTIGFIVGISKLPNADQIDWTKQDITLAELYNVSRERIRQVRRELNKGDSYNKRRKRKAVVCGGIVV